MKQKLFTLFLALVASVGAIYASNTKVDGIWYDFNESNKTATVTYRGSSYDSYNNEYSGKVVIPPSVTYNGITYSVTSIGDYAFCYCEYLTSVTIPNSVTSIGGHAFQSCYCKSLTSITIPNSVTSIGVSAFRNCTWLESVTIGNSVTSIGNEAFRECFSLTSITIGDSVTSIGGFAFQYCYSLTSITIGDSVKSIGGQAFRGCSSLTSIIIPNSVTSIGNNAFYECSSLTSVTIGNSVTSIGYYAFYGCSSLTSINVDSNNLNYSSVDGVLFNKDKTTLVVYPGGKQGAYTISNSVTSIEWFAFSLCSSLTSVTIPNSVTSIGGQAFRGCSSLTSIIIPNSVTSIGNNAFYECSSLTSVTIGNSVTSIGGQAFRGCSSLTSIIIPNSVTSIGGYAFYNCSSLTSITIPNSVTSIEIYAFSSCDKLVDIYCYATTPPRIYKNTFSHYNAFLYVPSTSVGLYQTAEVWKGFGNIQPIQAEDITDVSEAIITPSENEANVIWPSVNGAATYELVIRDKNGNIVCTLIFNANGQLTSIAFNAPSRNGVPAQTQSAGFSFTITGLDSGTNYDLTLTAKDNSGNIIEETTIPFQTNKPEGIEDVQSDEVQSTKVIKDGQVLILRNGKTYTMQGQEVK